MDEVAARIMMTMTASPPPIGVIVAADESPSTMKSRFEKIGIADMLKSPDGDGMSDADVDDAEKDGLDEGPF